MGLFQSTNKGSRERLEQPYCESTTIAIKWLGTKIPIINVESDETSEISALQVPEDRDVRVDIETTSITHCDNLAKFFQEMVQEAPPTHPDPNVKRIIEDVVPKLIKEDRDATQDVVNLLNQFEQLYSKRKDSKSKQNSKRKDSKSKQNSKRKDSKSKQNSKRKDSKSKPNTLLQLQDAIFLNKEGNHHKHAKLFQKMSLDILVKLWQDNETNVLFTERKAHEAYAKYSGSKVKMGKIMRLYKKGDIVATEPVGQRSMIHIKILVVSFDIVKEMFAEMLGVASDEDEKLSTLLKPIYTKMKEESGNNVFDHFYNVLENYRETVRITKTQRKTGKVDRILEIKAVYGVADPETKRMLAEIVSKFTDSDFVLSFKSLPKKTRDTIECIKNDYTRRTSGTRRCLMRLCQEITSSHA